MHSNVTKGSSLPADSDQVIDLAQQLIRIPSFTYQESEVARFLFDYLSKADLDCKLQEVPLPGGKISHQVTARWKGSRPGKKALLCGHLDILELYRPELWTVDPFEAAISDGWLYGQGSLNMKAGLAAQIGAVLALKSQHFDLTGEIVIAGVAAEIIGGLGARHLLKQESDFDYAIVAEPTNLCVANISVGTGQGILRLWGDTLYFNPHPNPIYAMARFLQEVGPPYGSLSPDGWMTYTPCPELPGFPRFNVRSIRSGQDCCEVSFDARIVPGQTNASLMADLVGVIEKLEAELPGIKAEIAIPASEEHSTFPAIRATSPEHPLIQALVDSHLEQAGQVPVVGAGDRIGLASDTSHIKAAGIPAVDYGPGKHPRWPMTDERLKVADILLATEVIKGTLQRLQNQVRR